LKKEAILTKTAVIVIADMHINSAVGLCPPIINLDDGGTYHASRTQRWLYSCYTDFWARVSREATGYRKILILDGDLGELDTKRRSVQLITANKSTILSTVRNVLEVASWDALYVVRGTPAHVGKSAWLEEEIGKDYDATQSQKNVHSFYQVRRTVNGKHLDIAHHAGMSGLGWGRSNSANKLISKALWDYKVDRSQPPPDIIDRAHNHIYVPAIGRDNALRCTIEAHFLPCWCGMTEYSYRAGYENVLPSIGGIVHYIEEDGGFVTKLYDYPLEKGKRLWATAL